MARGENRWERILVKLAHVLEDVVVCLSEIVGRKHNPNLVKNFSSLDDGLKILLYLGQRTAL